MLGKTAGNVPRMGILRVNQLSEFQLRRGRWTAGGSPVLETLESGKWVWDKKEGMKRV